MSSRKPLNLTNERVLITGAAGFIGYYVSNILCTTQGVKQVIGIDNMDPYYSAQIKTLRIQQLEKNQNFVFHKLSITDEKKIDMIFKTYKPTIVIHAAAEVGVVGGELHPHTYLETNIIGTSILLQRCSSAKHIIAISSSSVYGRSTTPPFRESDAVTFTSPASIYGTSKACMEFILYQFYQKTHIPTTIIRAFNVYGPNGRPDMLPMKILFHALTRKTLPIRGDNKTNKRDWTYIDDFVQGILSVLHHPNSCDIVNIGRGEPIGIMDTVRIAQKILKRYGHTLTISRKPLLTTEMRITHANIQKATKYGYAPSISFEEGFAKTAEFFFSHSHEI